ncbi:rod-determining factor RdfA [Halococcus agarilyticus]|uniref:rod-determining factor RdfA n=1 Tax=Halococcus agarilyticus TaxID=1232219 RepID=UPI0006780E4A|nr:rod-determining factor RdfA [Halococcus agarilyticus]
MAQSDAKSGNAGGPSCKLDRVIDEYELDRVAENLQEYWTREDERYSLRGLADYVNQAVLRTAMDREGLNPLDGEVENTHRLLTDDEVSQGVRTQAHSRLDRRGVDIDAVEGDFVSYQTVNRHLKECLGVERASAERTDSDRVDSGAQRIAALRNRTVAVTENTLDQLRSSGALALGEPDVYVDVTVTCTDCGTHGTVQELIDDGGCGCEPSDATS